MHVQGCVCVFTVWGVRWCVRLYVEAFVTHLFIHKGWLTGELVCSWRGWSIKSWRYTYPGVFLFRLQNEWPIEMDVSASSTIHLPACIPAGVTDCKYITHIELREKSLITWKRKKNKKKKLPKKLFTKNAVFLRALLFCIYLHLYWLTLFIGCLLMQTYTHTRTRIHSFIHSCMHTYTYTHTDTHL